MEPHTPAASRTDHTTATATTVTMPIATERRKAVFMIDHGSTWVSRSRALPPRRGVSHGRGSFAFPFPGFGAAVVTAAAATPADPPVRLAAAGGTGAGAGASSETPGP